MICKQATTSLQTNKCLLHGETVYLGLNTISPFPKTLLHDNKQEHKQQGLQNELPMVTFDRGMHRSCLPINAR